MLPNNNLFNKAYKFAIRTVRAYQFLTNEPKEFILSKQLLRSGTSIGANIAEANGAISDADFWHKISIAYKEGLETKYWISLLRDTDYLESKVADSLLSDADEITKICFSVLKTTRIDKKDK